MGNYEQPERRQMRRVLRKVANRIAALDANGIDVEHAKTYSISIQPMSLDEKSESRPTFFAPVPASMLLDPDDKYEEEEAPYPAFKPAEPGPVQNRALDMLNYFTYYTAACYWMDETESLHKLWPGVS